MRGWIRVRPHGELDLSSVDELDGTLRELRQTGFDQIELDLSSLTFIDSTGLRLVLVWDTVAQRDGMRLRLVPGPPAVQRVFEVTGVMERLPFAAAGDA
jgi:stage II sporulation protein AA (anti-sigma F factor antagonist)